jgi:hypothetical protein
MLRSCLGCWMRSNTRSWSRLTSTDAIAPAFLAHLSARCN